MTDHTITKREIHRLSKLKRHRHHHVVHRIHKKRLISYKTLFYIKEYGPQSHVIYVIVKESIKILLLASILSTVGGIHIKGMESILITVLPLLILLPALSDMIGDFGTIVSSKFTTMLFMHKVNKKWWHSEKVHELILTILVIGIISAVYIGSMSYIIAVVKGFELSVFIFIKILMIAVLATMSLVGIIIIISIIGGIWIYKKKEDPNNFLIPITTSVADLGSFIVFSLLVTTFF